MEATYETHIIGDGERIVYAPRRRQSLMYHKSVAEALKQHHQARTVAHDIGRFVQHDSDAIGAAREQELREQVIALRRVEIAPDALSNMRTVCVAFASSS